MKKKYFLFSIFLSSFAFSQVGINTTDPKEKLHVKGNMRYETTDIANPSQQGKLLVSDTNGNAKWQTVTITTIPAQLGVFNLTNGLTRSETLGTTPDGTNYFYSGASITLPKGKWIVSISMNLNITTETGTQLPSNQSVWARTAFFNDANVNVPQNQTSGDHRTPPLMSRYIMSPAQNTIITGDVIIENTSAGPKTYFYKIRLQLFGNTQNVRVNNFGGAPTGGDSNNNVNKIIAISADK